MKAVITALILLVILFFSCNDPNEKKEIEVRQSFELNTSAKQKKLANDFLDGKIKFGENFEGINGGFYCLWKRKSEDISPHFALNDMFINEHYKITTKKDSLEYIVISENISHKIGTYTNGGDASKMETIISVIDVKKGLAYIVDKEMGSDPPTSILTRAGNNSGSIGSVFSDKDIFDFLKKNVIKK